MLQTYEHKMNSLGVGMALIYLVEIFSSFSIDLEDYSSAGRYHVTFPQTVLTDQDTPAPFAESFPFSINISDDHILEGLEYFQVHIVETSELILVRIGQRNTVNVTILDDEGFSTSESFIILANLLIRGFSEDDYVLVNTLRVLLLRVQILVIFMCCV